jgi:uncharacterized protein (DUF305 family)
MKKPLKSATLALLLLAVPVAIGVVAWARTANVNTCLQSSNGMRTPGAASASQTAESSFVTENAAAMDKMMTAMAVRASGDVDADFVAMMIPHHQGAIDMAQTVLHYGKNEQIRRLAQEIIVTQQEEIAAMRLALVQPLPPSIPAPTQPQSSLSPVSRPTRASPQRRSLSIVLPGAQTP